MWLTSAETFGIPSIQNSFSSFRFLIFKLFIRSYVYLRSTFTTILIWISLLVTGQKFGLDLVCFWAFESVLKAGNPDTKTKLSF